MVVLPDSKHKIVICNPRRDSYYGQRSKRGEQHEEA